MRLDAPPPRARRPARRAALPLRRRRFAPVAVIAAGALAAGVLAGASAEPAGVALARSYGEAWERGDHAAMHALLTPAARRRFPLREFARAHRRAMATATARGVRTGGPRALADTEVALPAEIPTRLFGTLVLEARLPVAGRGEGVGVDWRPHLVLPGLRAGEEPGREMRMPPRAAILARDGTPLARGAGRASPLGPAATEVAGVVGPAPAERASDLAARGIPAGAPVGLTGLEREFDRRLAGTPGGVLRAGERVLARAAPRPGRAVRTTIDPEIQAAAVTALAGRYGGVAALRPADGEVLALAGLAASAPQPPGSVFKIVTLAGALEAGVTRPAERFPVETAATLEGVRLENAHGEACGGTLREAFARSCNSVFAPLGARLGAARLVAAAERFGFNEPPALRLAARSTLPPAAEIGDDLAVGSTAIGQGKVLATALHMASVAGTVAAGGLRTRPTLRLDDAVRAERAMDAGDAAFVGRAMRAVVTEGTGREAALEDVRVAGKTGTAELRSTVSRDPVPGDPFVPPVEDTTDTDAWFVGYAPVREPRVAVAVLLVAQGTGGETAAPAAREILRAGAG